MGAHAPDSLCEVRPAWIGRTDKKWKDSWRESVLRLSEPSAQIGCGPESHCRNHAFPLSLADRADATVSSTPRQACPAIFHPPPRRCIDAAKRPPRSIPRFTDHPQTPLRLSQSALPEMPAKGSWFTTCAGSDDGGAMVCTAAVSCLPWSGPQLAADRGQPSAICHYGIKRRKTRVNRMCNASDVVRCNLFSDR